MLLAAQGRRAGRSDLTSNNLILGNHQKNDLILKVLVGFSAAARRARYLSCVEECLFVQSFYYKYLVYKKSYVFVLKNDIIVFSMAILNQGKFYFCFLC
jgi:hypothetical protein